MKKVLISIFSVLIFAFSGTLFSLGGNFSNAANEKAFTLSSENFLEIMTSDEIYDDGEVEIKLSGDIDLQDVDLTAITNINRYFKGSFDGQGYSILNPSFASSSQYFGLFPKAEGATISNVKIGGKVSYQFSSTNIKELYVGALVGYGINVNFSSCELDYELAESSVQIPVYSNINLGGLCGRLRNDNGISSSIQNCINYYNYNIDLIKDSGVKVGGLVGSGDNVNLINNLSFGNIALTNSLTKEQLSNVYIGGLVGAVNGSDSKIRNSCFGGLITPNLSTSHILVGGIVGGALSSQPTKSNFNFIYYSDLNLKPSGDSFLSLTDKVAKVKSLNREFLSNPKNFDPASSSSFDFEKVFILHNSNIHLQNFQTFEFKIDDTSYSDGQKIESAFFSDAAGQHFDTLTCKYNTSVNININLKEENYGYYVLSKILLNQNELNSSLYKSNEIVGEDDKVTGYFVSLSANALTSGTYSFTIIAKEYKCEVAISESAKANNEGGIIIDDGSSLSTNDISLSFYSSTNERKILAVGTGIYSFDYWDLYFRDSNGNFTVKSEFDNYQDTKLTIKFGDAPFNKEFKLVANFTDAAAIKVDFGRINKQIIKKIVFSGIEYDATPIMVSSRSSQPLEVTVDKDYKIDVDIFTRDIAQLYGDNPTTTLGGGEPELNEDGDKVYKFSINMRFIQDVEDNSIKLAFVTRDDKSGSGDSLLWLYIVLPIAAVVIIGVIVFIAIRRRRGGRRGSSKSSGKVKKESYKDYY